MQIRDCERRDVAPVCDIYNHYITHTAITFEEEPLAVVRLHEYFGFIKVGHFCEVGRKFGKWLDVGYWQRPGRTQQ